MLVALNTVCELSRYLLALSILIPHLWRILFIPVDNILISQYDNVTFTITVLHTSQTHRTYITHQSHSSHTHTHTASLTQHMHTSQTQVK